MTSFVLVIAGTYGVFLMYTSIAFGWQGLGMAPARPGPVRRRRRAEEWLAQAGLDGVRPSEFVTVMAVILVVATALGFAVFGTPVPALVVGAFAATYPITAYRARRQRRRQQAGEAWPRMIEKMALLTGSLGRSVPQALFEVGNRSPDEVKPAFAAAHREWLLTTDFTSTVAVLKRGLADPTADAACETLLVAHEVGGTDVERRLAALVEDRIADLQGRKDARARQAGVRFARRFVLFVPFGMALVGLSIGDGRAAYQTQTGQFGAVLGVAMVIACWVWSGRIMRLPEEERVFYD